MGAGWRTVCCLHKKRNKNREGHPYCCQGTTLSKFQGQMQEPAPRLGDMDQSELLPPTRLGNRQVGEPGNGPTASPPPWSPPCRAPCPVCGGGGVAVYQKSTCFVPRCRRGCRVSSRRFKALVNCSLRPQERRPGMECRVGREGRRVLFAAMNNINMYREHVNLGGIDDAVVR